MNGDMLEPRFKEFDGIYFGSPDDSFIMPPNEYDLSKLGKYLRDNNKQFNELTAEEKDRFKFD